MAIGVGKQSGSMRYSNGPYRFNIPWRTLLCVCILGMIGWGIVALAS